MLLDTSGLYALLDDSEWRHAVAKQEFERATVIFTHAYVLVELVALGQARGVPREVLLDFVSAILSGTDVEVIWCDRNLHEAAHRLLLARLDKTYSLCDAASFVLMRLRGDHEALTTDHHIDQEGFVRLLAR